MEGQYQLDHSLDNYIETLIKYGVKVSKKLSPAIFYLKNGLKYPGLLANQQVNGVQQLVKLPIQLVLTSHKALKDPRLTQVFSNRFYKEGILWQDRILVTYLLYLISVGNNDIWTFMANNFSKNIDIISFWENEEFDRFIDQSVIKAARKERNHFQEQYERFEQIQNQYEILQDTKWFNRQNYKWVYIHTVSRCFGSYLNSTYFVPYCELFNHHYVNVSYKCFQEKQQQIFGKKTGIQAQQDQESAKSIESGYSEDYISDDDFDYLSINSYSIRWLTKISYDLKDKEVKVIDKTLKDIYEWMDRQLEWKGFTFIYLGQIIEKLKILENQYKAGRKKFQYTLQKIEETKLHIYAYRKYLVEHYRAEGKQYQKVKDEKGAEVVHTKNTSWTNYEKSKEERNLNYTHFQMQARQGAHFDKNTQIYFCYGKHSNRTLLVRYGFCLQNNPFEHVWIKYCLRKQIQPYPDLFEQIQEKGLAINYKMKLKSYTLALQPFILMRMTKWKLTHHNLQHIFFITDIDHQIDNIQKVREVYLRYLLLYKDIKEDLTDSSMGYHQYFVRVYNVEKKKIINYQLELLQDIQTILKKIKNNQIVLKQFMKQKGYAKALKHYFQGLRGLK